ncbi:unnamed protein product [Aphis gossypii]|uniref:Uncharacterized protein n=1 Tax=Aphis gossypii TaxID=80765 RepID=A0A9P0J4N7_APHGO|nr:unnamed protein product [Aphis gossypii]
MAGIITTNDRITEVRNIYIYIYNILYEVDWWSDAKKYLYILCTMRPCIQELFAAIVSHGFGTNMNSIILYKILQLCFKRPSCTAMVADGHHSSAALPTPLHTSSLSRVIQPSQGYYLIFLILYIYSQ